MLVSCLLSSAMVDFIYGLVNFTEVIKTLTLDYQYCFYEAYGRLL